MPTIYDNIDKKLLDDLKKYMPYAKRADFCVGYFNLRGWKDIAEEIDQLAGEIVQENRKGVHRVCRLLVGMQKMPFAVARDMQRRRKDDDVEIDMESASKIKRQLAEEFKKQLTQGTPNKADEKGLQKLLGQLKEGRVVVKLYMRHTLHAKLYLLLNKDDVRKPIAPFLGSSNLTFSGLSGQGELNIDVDDKDAGEKLANWFNARWADAFCWDITAELIDVISESWASDVARPPYYVYLKILYHLAREARTGVNEFKLPERFEKELLPFQQQAVQIAAHHLNKRGGVLLGDVVGLGKTITAAALAKLFEDDFGYETLIICPPNLIHMWEHYKYTYRLHSKIISIGAVQSELKDLPLYRLVIIDESHNLRNREGSRYAAIRDYLNKGKSKVVLLSATPYNKTYLDLANQLRLFLAEDADLGITPERYIASLGGISQFQSKHTDIFVRSLKAFEQSEHSDDWRELMRLFLVRRTRGFIRQHHAETDSSNSRKYLSFSNGQRAYFPDRVPKKIAYLFDATDKSDQYAQLYAAPVVDMLQGLQLPRYGLANYINPKAKITLTKEEEGITQNLSRAGKRLMGFCRTNLFKRLESSGYSFLLSLSRHVLRNAVFIHAIQHDLPLPIGKSDSLSLDNFIEDMDGEELIDTYQSEAAASVQSNFLRIPHSAADYAKQAAAIYETLNNFFKLKVGWIRAKAFSDKLLETLVADNEALLAMLAAHKGWDTDNDKQLNALHELCTGVHKGEKILIFTQYADTAEYLYAQLSARGLKQIGCVTGSAADTVALVQAFSPTANKVANIKGSDKELRILIATDVLSEGQNLQDAHIIVNYDLPWAIIRLIQRAGRVDRIGQQATEILCYSFLPEEGIENIISLRDRLQRRIKENADVVGSDEVFFDGDPVNISDLYSEKSGILDEAEDDDVDLSSYAFQLWKTATDANVELLRIIPKIENVVSATKAAEEKQAKGAIVYTRTQSDNDVLVWLNERGEIVTHSQWQMLKALACAPQTPSLEFEGLYALEEKAVDLVETQESNFVGGALGKPSSVKNRVYTQLQRYYDSFRHTLFQKDLLLVALDAIYAYPLREGAKDILQRQLKAGIGSEQLAELVLGLHESKQLCIIADDNGGAEPPQIICAMGLV